MDDKQHSPAAGSGTTHTQAAAELAEIQRRQERVIKAALVPSWYWWVIAGAIIAIGVARDNAKPVVLATVIPLAVLVIAAVIVATVPAVRRVQVTGAPSSNARVAVAIVSLIVLVDAVVIAIAAGLSAAHDRYPVTIGSAAGAVVLVVGGSLVNAYVRRLTLDQVRRQTGDAADAVGRTR